MKYTRGQFTSEYYQIWEMGLLIPTPENASIYSVKYRKNHFDEYSRVTLKAVSVSDALERACYAITYASPWRPEDIDLHAVYDRDENLLWIDEPFYALVQKKNEFRGMERREFLAAFGVTSAGILFGLRPEWARAGQTTVSMSGTGSGFNIVGEQLYTTSGSYSWTVPAGVTSCCVVCVGGGGGASSSGAGGGALRYGNNIAITPGSSMTVTVGAKGVNSGYSNPGYSGGSTTFGSVVAGGGAGTASYSTGIYTGGAGGTGSGGTGGGSGGAGGNSLSSSNGPGGGGAGGYSGNGGNGGVGNGYSGAGGGGVGLFGIGSNGAGGVNVGNPESNGYAGTGGGGGGGAGNKGTQSQVVNSGGGGGSGGANGTNAAQAAAGVGNGGAYGGGCGAKDGNQASDSGSGAVRIIWGTGRSFPNNAS